jgi:hypothetical protein
MFTFFLIFLFFFANFPDVWLGLFDNKESVDSKELLEIRRKIDDEVFPPRNLFCCVKEEKKSCVHVFCHNFNKKKKNFVLFTCGNLIHCFVCWYGWSKGLNDHGQNTFLEGKSLPKITTPRTLNAIVIKTVFTIACWTHIRNCLHFVHMHTPQNTVLIIRYVPIHFPLFL